MRFTDLKIAGEMCEQSISERIRFNETRAP